MLCLSFVAVNVLKPRVPEYAMQGAIELRHPSSSQLTIQVVSVVHHPEVPLLHLHPVTVDLRM
jgi:hypothetical protein